MRRAPAWLLIWLLAGCGSEVEPPRHLLLVTVDTLRADHLGSYGGEYGLTPSIDALAERSVRFARAYATAPVTLPSVAALLTGRHPEQLGIRSNLGVLPDEVPTLATRFRSAGFRTAAVVSNPVLSRRTGLDRGFDLYDQELPNREEPRGTPERIASGTTDAAIEALDRLLAEDRSRLLLWVHYQDPHGPYTPPADLRERYLEGARRRPQGERELPVMKGWSGVEAIPSYQYIPPHREAAYYLAGYAGEIRYVDSEIGRLLEAMEARGALDESAVVFAADHGEGLGERDYWFAHGEYLNEPALRVPLLLHLPSQPGRVREDPASLIDVLPTLAALFELPEETAAPGRDLRDVDPAGADRAIFFGASPARERTRAGVTRGGYKLVRSENAAGRREVLYRLPDESTDLSDSLPELAQALARELDAKVAPRRRETRERVPTPDERETLRALGYSTP